MTKSQRRLDNNIKRYKQYAIEDPENKEYWEDQIKGIKEQIMIRGKNKRINEKAYRKAN